MNLPTSIRFAVFETGESPRSILSDNIDRIGPGPRSLTITRAGKAPQKPRKLIAADHPATVAHLLGWLEIKPRFNAIRGVVHRVVHGMQHTEPERITPKLLAELRRITASRVEVRAIRTDEELMIAKSVITNFPRTGRL